MKQSAGGDFTPIPHCSSQLVIPGPRSYVLLPVTAAKYALPHGTKSKSMISGTPGAEKVALTFCTGRHRGAVTESDGAGGGNRGRPEPRDARGGLQLPSMCAHIPVPVPLLAAWTSQSFAVESTTGQQQQRRHVAYRSHLDAHRSDALRVEHHLHLSIRRMRDGRYCRQEQSSRGDGCEHCTLW